MTSSFTPTSGLNSLDGLMTNGGTFADITVSNNDFLSSLEGLPAFTSVTGALTIEDNAILSTCCDLTCTLVGNVIAGGGTVDIMNNATGCNSVQEIATTTLQLGYNSTVGATYFDGELCDVAIYNKELSSAEVTTLYKSIC